MLLSSLSVRKNDELLSLSLLFLPLESERKWRVSIKKKLLMAGLILVMCISCKSLYYGEDKATTRVSWPQSCQKLEQHSNIPERDVAVIMNS